MRNFFKITKAGLLAGLCLLVTLKATAQLGVGVFNETRTTQFFPMTKGAAAANLFTNSIQDLFQYQGRGEFIINMLTNGAGAQATSQAYLYTSPDTTNWTPVANYAIINGPTGVFSTNYYYGFGTNGTGGILTSNQPFLPYSLVTPNPSVNMFATPYQAWDLFTNSGPANLNLGSGGNGGTTIIGANVQDFGRYWELVITNGGNATNGSEVFSAQFIGTPKNYLAP